MKHCLSTSVEKVSGDAISVVCNGAVTQLVECYPCKVEVESSNLFSSTIIEEYINWQMACFGSMRLRVQIPALRPCRYGDNKPMQIYQAWAALSRRLKEYGHYAGMAEWQTHLTQNQASIPHVGSSPTSSTTSRQFQQSKLDKFMSSVRIRFRAFWHR